MLIVQAHSKPADARTLSSWGSPLGSTLMVLPMILSVTRCCNVQGQLQQAIERNRGELVQKFSSAQSSSAQPRGNDSAGSASVSLHAACEILSAGPFAPGGQQATPDACAARWRLLMLMLVNWDASGQGRVSAVQVLRMLKLVKLRKVGTGSTVWIRSCCVFAV